MQFYRKTRRGFRIIPIKLLVKFSVFVIVIMAIIFLVGNLDLPKPNKIIKQEIPNETFKVIK